MRRGEAAVLLLLGAGAACGRSELDADLVLRIDDGGTVSDASQPAVDSAPTFDAPEAGGDEADVSDTDTGMKPPPCGPSTCKGCCDSNGCQGGSADEACGGGGHRCDVCSTEFNCDGQGCELDDGPSDCSPANCPSGCCAHANGISNDVYCYEGTGDSVCGLGGQDCSDCTENNLECKNHVCGAQFCGSGNCSNGCCLGNECTQGTDDLACGTGGANCQNCTTSGNTCQLGSYPGGQCKPPACTAGTCPTGCCVDDICAEGTQDSACGTGGVACVNCLPNGETCSVGKCR